MARDEIYKGPPTAKPVAPVVIGESTVADQARMFGVPEEQLQPRAQDTMWVIKEGVMTEVKVSKVYLGGTVR